MTSNIFENWLRGLDKMFNRQGRKVLLLLDNCSAHPNVANLTAITMKFLPPNSTTCLQPMDQGIIKNLKVSYRRLVVERVLAAIDSGQQVDNSTVTLLDAIRMLHNAFLTVTAETISNCFRHAGFGQSDPQTHPASFSLECAEDAWLRLQLSGFVPSDNTIGFEDFCTADAELVTHGDMTDSDIVKVVTETTDGRGSNDSDNDDDEISQSQVTSADALSAVSVVRRWMESNNTEKLRELIEIENCILSSRRVQQKTITAFFNKP